MLRITSLSALRSARELGLLVAVFSALVVGTASAQVDRAVLSGTDAEETEA